MAVEHLSTAEIAARNADGVISMNDAKRTGGVVRCYSGTVEVSSAASVNSTYHVATLPSDAVILGVSRLYGDDLASSGSPTLDIGVFNPTGQSEITDDDDALNAGISATAAIDTPVVADIVDYGKPLWAYVNGQTTNPGGELDVKVTIKDAACNTGGTLSVELLYLGA